MRSIVPFAAVASLAALAFLALFVASVDPSQAPLVPRLPEGAARTGWALLGLAAVGTAVSALVAELRRRRQADSSGRERPVSLWPLFLISAAAVAATMGITAFFLSLLKQPEELQPSGPESAVERKADEERKLEEGPTMVRSSIDAKRLGPYGLAALVAATAVLLALLALRVARSRGEGAGEGEEPGVLRRELAAGLRMSLAAILADADLRRAVIACYARMAARFSEAGYRREPAETPLEYLDRVMRESRAVAAPFEERLKAALGSLTELYEVARFSEHAVFPEERTRAVEALRTLESILGSEPDAGVDIA